MKTPSFSFALIVGLTALVATVVLFPPSPVRETARRSVAGSNLRQIGQASLIYGSDHGDKLPNEENLWDYAGELALGGGLNDASTWVSGGDPANEGSWASLSMVLAADRRGLEPSFRGMAPSWAVPLGRLDATMPSTIPIAWTRGLRPDGTWPAHAPNGTDGGHVAFLGGNVTFYRNTRNAFHRFDGQGMTSNVLEALPPETRIGEYTPSDAEQSAWSRARRIEKATAMLRRFILPGLWALSLVVLLAQVARKRCSMRVIWWFLALSFFAAVVSPTVC
jgi:hypothetical protein